jgi:signal transduction histidine kinase
MRTINTNIFHGFLIGLIFLCSNAFPLSKNIPTDSVKQLLESSTKEQKLEILLSSAEKLVVKQPQEAIIYAQKALTLAIEQGNNSSIAHAQFLLAKAQYSLGQYNLAIQNLDTAFEYFKSIKDSMGIAESHQLFGQIYTRIGDFKKAIDNTQEAFSISSFIKAKDKLVELTRELGNIYFYFGEKTIALDFYQKSLNQSITNKDREGIAKAYNNMGRIYSELGKHDMALDLLKKALAAKIREDDKISYANTLLNIGTVYLKKADYPKALSFFDEARADFSSVHNSEGMTNSLYYLGVTYFRMGRFNQALALQEEAWKLASETNTKRIMVDISHATADIYEKIGDYKRAYSHFKTYYSLRDSVFSEEKSKLLIELETKYQVHVKQRQIELLSKDKELKDSKKNKSRVWIALLSVVAIFFISLTYFAYNKYRYKSKANLKLLDEIGHRKLVERQLNEFQDQLETLVDERTRELKIAKEKAEDADKLKTAFLTNMSHEIRTPMNAIVGFSYLLTDSESNEETKSEYIKIIKSNGEVLMNLINDILDISLIESGQLKIKNKPFDLEDLLLELKFFFDQEKEKIHKNDISIFTDIDTDFGGLIVNSDKIRIRQILSNLLWNAVKFTNNGSISFGYRLSGTEEIIFFVKDTGIGIEPDKHTLIFERFSKFNTSNESTLYSGTGLGLAICNELVTALNGKIWLDSLPGKGSTFYFTIPFTTNGHKDIEPKFKIYEIDKSKLLNKTILVAEDVASNFKLVEAFLSNLNMNILWAKDGIEAITLFRENPTTSIVLMDIQMPLMDGLTALKQIRRINPKIPVIVNTAFYLTEEMEKSFAAGCTDYITKPIRKEDLLLKLSQYIS